MESDTVFEDLMIASAHISTEKYGDPNRIVLERKESLSPGETEANSIVNIQLGSDDVKKVDLDRVASDSDEYFQA